MLFYLSNYAMVMLALRIRVQQSMQFRRGSQQKGPHPQDEHQACRCVFASLPLMP
jgi:hypothetical protein